MRADLVCRPCSTRHVGGRSHAAFAEGFRKNTGCDNSNPCTRCARCNHIEDSDSCDRNTSKRGQTLDQIIQRLMPAAPVQKDVIRRAFVNANPTAFRKGNPNWLYAGVTLTVPTLDNFRAVVFKSNALDLKKNVSDEKATWVRFP
jgi:Tfp pilus assembly protein FimV